MSRKFSPRAYRFPLLGSALSLVLAVGDAQALGLGGLRVQSALNQPFVGEIALLDVKPDELDAIKVQIASIEEFSKVGAERYHYLSQLRFTPQISPRGETVIRVSSREPIREPFMDLLVEVNWPKGRLLKGYTVLLDPPVAGGRRPARIEPPLVQSPGSAIQTSAQTGASAQPPLAPRQRQRAPVPASPPPAPATVAMSSAAGAFPKEIGPVPRGSGLWRLASRHAPGGASAAQTAMALYRNNQDAFVNGDINRLRVGKVLVIPNATELFVLGPDAAQKEFAAALRGEKVRRSPITEATASGPGAESRLKIAGAAAEAPAPSAPSAATVDTPETVEQELLLVREASESTRQETAELRDRIRELEGQLGEIQKLLRLRNAELARIQGAGAVVARALESGTPAEPAEPGQPRPEPESDPLRSRIEAPTEGAADRLPEEVLAASGAPGVPVGALDSGSAPGVSESVGSGGVEAPPATAPEGLAGASEPPGPIPGTAESAAPMGPPRPSGAVGEASQGPSAEAPGPATPGSSEPASQQAEPTPDPVTPEGHSGSWAGLPGPWLDLWTPIAGAVGAVVLGFGALAWVRARRRRSLVDAELGPESDGQVCESTSPATVADQQIAPRYGATGSAEDLGQAQETVSPPSLFTTLGYSHGDTEEADVLSEADIYIAYGRYREAEELLLEELEHTPGRVELKYKLAESYHGAKNYPALDALMREMQGAGEDRLDPDRWQRLVDMAKAIEGLERADAGVRPALGQRAATAGFGLEGRADPRPTDGFLPDNSGVRDALRGLGSAAGYDQSTAAGQDPSIRDVPVLRSSHPAPVTRGYQGPPSLDLDVLPESLDLDDALAAEGDREMPLEGFGAEPVGAVSDLELTIDDLRAASDLDLESFVDSTRTISRLVDEPLPGQGGGPGDLAGHPARLRAVGAGDVGDGQTPIGPFEGLDEFGSSDLLSSQWQMDSGLWDEIATKLDLARAYMEMGDQDSAKGILEEVVNEGNEDQQGEANQMLRALG